MSPDEGPIPLVDLGEVHRPLEPALADAFRRVLRSASFIGGQEVEAFEHELAEVLGVREVVGVASGTAALHLALVAAGIGPGDEVVLPANTFFATAEAVIAAGATPVLVDADPSTALIDVDHLRASISPSTAAVIPVHLYGQPAPMDEISAMAERHGLFVLEDAAQAIGARLDGRPTGSLGHAGAFSFYPGKNLGALGDAGAVTTNDRTLADRVRALRSHGETTKHRHMVSGLCERLDGLQAAFLRVKLPLVPEWQKERAELVARYRDGLAGRPEVEQLAMDPRGVHAHHLYVVKVPERDRVLAELRDRGIGAAVHYPAPIHFQPPTAHLAHPGELPGAESLTSSVLSLPLFPGMTDAQLERCLTALTDALRVSR